MYTTKEAAQLLGVSVRRVNALVTSGDLSARKFGNAWMIDEASVANRAHTRRTAGRPKMGEKDPSNIVRCTLMSKDKPVLRFAYNRRTGQTADVEPLEGVRFAPLGVGADGKPNRYDLSAWLASRSIPDFRRSIGQVLRTLRFARTSDLMIEGWGLSLSDPYWFAPEGCDAEWGDINYFDNGYDQMLGDMMLGIGDGSFDVDGANERGGAERPFRSPDATTAGALVKTWVREDGVDYLVKGGFGAENREPYNEVLATRLLSRLLDEGEFVPYGLARRHGRVYSICPAMTSADWELVPAADVATAFSITDGRDLHRGYLDALSQLGVRNARTSIDKMIVVDHIMANFDRHTHNFGLLRSTEHPDEFQIAPLFDNGCGFYSRATVDELRRGRYLWESHPFREYPSQQLALVEDVGWFDPGRLGGFIDEIADVLSQNPHLSEEFITLVQRHTQRQIDAVCDIAAERGMVFAGF